MSSDFRQKLYLFAFILLTFCIGGFATAILALLARIYIPKTPERGTLKKANPDSLRDSRLLDTSMIPRMFGSHHTFMNPVDAPNLITPWFVKIPLVQQITNRLLYPQSRSVREQMVAGVRAFDLRIDVDDDGKVCICHHWISTLTLQEALNMLARLPTPVTPESTYLVWIRWSGQVNAKKRKEHSGKVYSATIDTLQLQPGIFDVLFDGTWIVRRKQLRGVWGGKTTVTWDEQTSSWGYPGPRVFDFFPDGTKHMSPDAFTDRIRQRCDTMRYYSPDHLLMINTFTTFPSISTLMWSILYTCVLPAIGGGLLCGLSVVFGKWRRHKYPIVTVCVAWLVYCSIVLPAIVATRRRTPLMRKDQHSLMDYQQPAPTVVGLCNGATLIKEGRNNVIFWLDFV